MYAQTQLSSTLIYGKISFHFLTLLQMCYFVDFQDVQIARVRNISYFSRTVYTF